jgi:hypothetical protein
MSTRRRSNRREGVAYTVDDLGSLGQFYDLYLPWGHYLYGKLTLWSIVEKNGLMFLASITDPTNLGRNVRSLRQFHIFFVFFPTLLTSVWLWLYAGAGFLLKAARRFDLGFDWFNRKFDIEKKPLQSIGLVAGALVAVVYWAAVIVSRVVS